METGEPPNKGAGYVHARVAHQRQPPRFPVRFAKSRVVIDRGQRRFVVTGKRKQHSENTRDEEQEHAPARRGVSGKVKAFPEHLAE